MNRVALITGITGQDGSYLAEFLLSKGYIVHGMHRRASAPNNKRISYLLDNKEFHLHYGEMTDDVSIEHVVERTKPDEVYNLASQSQVHVSFTQPNYTRATNFLGVQKLVEAVRQHCPKARFYQASTSEMFGNSPPPHNEETPLNPVSPYAVSKALAHSYIQMARTWGFFGTCGILFNHASPRRGIEFVTQKIIKGIVDIKEGKKERITLGNLDARRDWRYAKEYVEAMWIMLQHHQPDDFVIGSGVTHTIRQFLDKAFTQAGYKNWDDFVEIDQKFIRPQDVDILKADTSKAKRILGWEPKTNLDTLIKIMLDAEMEARGLS